MYYTIAKDFLLQDSAIIGIFDLDNASYAKSTRAFLQAQQKRGAMVDLSADLPESFVLATDMFGQPAVYLSETPGRTLAKRISRGGNLPPGVSPVY